MWRLPVNLLLGAPAAGGIILVFLLRLVMGERPRGEVGLIFAGIGASLTLPNAQGVSKPIVGAATFGFILIMVIITTLVTPPLLNMVARTRPLRSEPPDYGIRMMNERSHGHSATGEHPRSGI